MTTSSSRILRLLSMATALGREVFVRQERAIIGRADSRPTLAGIRCPALVICGRQDRLTSPEVHEEIVAGIPGAQLVVIEECGHLSPLEQPEKLTTLLHDWLYELLGSPQRNPN